MNSPDLQMLATRLKKASLKDNRVTACCPFHEESTPSFVVYASGGWNCLGCNERGNWKKLYTHLGLEVPAETEWRKPPPIVYEYQDRTGACIGRVERIDLGTDKKTFVQYTLEGGRWVAAKKYPLPFFHLPRLLKADHGSVVFVTEGEKCVEAVASVGGLATCCSGGANGLKYSDHSSFEALKGKRVVIVPDNDDQGEAYAQSWLRECRARRIEACIVHLKTTRKKYDIYDYLADGGKLTELMSYHVVADVDGNMNAAVVYCDRVADHFRRDRAGAGPALYHKFLA